MAHLFAILVEAGQVVAGAPDECRAARSQRPVHEPVRHGHEEHGCTHNSQEEFIFLGLRVFQSIIVTLNPKTSIRMGCDKSQTRCVVHAEYVQGVTPQRSSPAV